MPSEKRMKKKAIALMVVFATVLSLWYDGEIINSINQTLSLTKNNRMLSLNLGNGTCEWQGALQFTDAGFPSDADLTKTIIAGYPSGDKRLTFIQLEALTGLSARDEWDFMFLGTTNQPFIKANYPHHEGIWGWGDIGDQVILVVSKLQKVLIEYHDILWDIGYAQTFEEAYERIESLYTENAEGADENPPVADFLIWRDLRVFDEIHWYSWFIDYYMEAGLQRDMFTHNLTKPTQWMMAILPNFFTKFEMRHGRFVDGNETIEPSYDPMCDTLSKGCYPQLVVDPEKLVNHTYGPAEARKIAQVVNGTQGFDDWMIEEEVWECLWEEIIINRKGISTFLDREIDYNSYTYSFEMKNEMHHEINRLIEKYQDKTDEVAVELIKILTGHRDELGVTDPIDPISYEDLMSYHLAYPPFFPNQKPFESNDDFFVKVNEPYADLDLSDVENIINNRREWFEEEMEKKRERKISVKYFDATGWTNLPEAGLHSLTPYATDTVTRIRYQKTDGVCAGSDRDTNVGALFEGYVNVDPVVEDICIRSDDGSKLYVDDVLVLNLDGMHAAYTSCTPITAGKHKIVVEYFEAAGDCVLRLTWQDSKNGRRIIPPRAWASDDENRRHRNLSRAHEMLELDLLTLKETDIMGPFTRAEFNRRKQEAQDPSAIPEQGFKNEYDFSKLDEILVKRTR